MFVVQTAPHTLSMPIVISMGDAAGIGAEIIAKSYAYSFESNESASETMHGTVVLGDVACMRRAVQVCGLRLMVAEYASLDGVLDCPPNCIPVLQVDGLNALPDFGVVDATVGAYAARCVERAQR